MQSREQVTNLDEERIDVIMICVVNFIALQTALLTSCNSTGPWCISWFY